MIDAHSVTIASSSGAVLPLSGEMTLDESWSPYVQGQFICSLPAAEPLLSSLDPRNGARLSGQAQRDFGDVWSNADFTAAFPANATNAQITAAMPANATNAQISAMFFRPWNSFGIRDSDIRPFDLAVRGRTIDHVAQTVTLDVASDEALLQDRGLIASVKYINDTTSLRALIGYVLQNQIGASLQPGTFDATITLGALEWLPGVDGQAYLQPAIDAAGGRLWCDEQRRWYFTQRAPLIDGQLSLSVGDSGSITNATDEVTRDGDWCDAVVVDYVQTNGSGATVHTYDTAGPSTAVKVQLVTVEASYPGPGYAAALLTRAKGRGRVLGLTSVSDYRGTPGQAFAATLPDTDVQTGVVSALTWRWPEAEMDVKTRGLIDTPSTAWVFDPPGLSWASIPVGTDWTEDI